MEGKDSVYSTQKAITVQKAVTVKEEFDELHSVKLRTSLHQKTPLRQ